MMNMKTDLFMVLDTLRCRTLRSDGVQLTAGQQRGWTHAAAAGQSNFVVKHRLPFQGGLGTPGGASFLWEPPAPNYSIFKRPGGELSKKLRKDNLYADTISGIIDISKVSSEFPP